MLEEDVLKFLRGFFAVDYKSPEGFKDLFLSLDSLDTLDLAYQLEEHFNIRLDKDSRITNVNDLIKIIETKSAAA